MTALPILGLVLGGGIGYLIFRIGDSFIHWVVPGRGIYFSVHPAAGNSKKYLLKQIDIRGNPLSTIGILQPNSVVRISVLAPEIAASFYAQDPWDHVMLDRSGKFVPVRDEERYLVFSTNLRIQLES